MVGLFYKAMKTALLHPAFFVLFLMVLIKNLMLKFNTRINSFFFRSIKIIVCSIFIFLSLNTYASVRDTVLNAVYSQPFFYNVLADKKGSIFVGTSEGIFQLEGTTLVPYNKKEGYITLDKSGEPAISPDGIKNYYERKYLNMLPFPELSRDEYHAGSEDHFYICSGGRIYIYDIVPYRYSYAGYSIRTISEDFVGTYTGIYFRGKRLPFPIFTDGYIREINGLAYVCYDGLITIDPSMVQSAKYDSVIKGIKPINNTGALQFRDVCLSKYNGSYYLSSVTDLLKMKKGGVPFSVYKTSKKISELVIVGEYKSSLFFSDGNYILKLSSLVDKADTLTRLPAEILDGSVTSRNIYLLTSEGLYQLDSDNEVEKLTSLSQAHTMELISPTEMLIATNNGLFRFNAVNKVLAPLIRGIEFNRKALFKNGDLLQAGSINGLYTIDIKDLDLLSSRNTSFMNEGQIPQYIIIVLAVIILLIGVLLFMLFQARKKVATTTIQLEELNHDLLSREKIEQYIRENLSTASLKSITDHYNTNNSHIYRLIEPDKPGSIIQKMRNEKLIELQKAGKNISEIAEATGLSVAYLKKIRNKFES